MLTPLVATAQNTGVPIIAAMSSEEQEAAKVVDAWITGEGRTTGNYKDKPVDRVTTETAILYKAAEGWRIGYIHWLSRAAA